MRKMIENMMKKVFLMLAAGLLLTTSCNQKVKVTDSKQKIKVFDSETNEEIDLAAATGINSKFVDLGLPGPQGQTVWVGDYVGQNKLVLIDFWASWCGPCIRELPNVVKAYERFHDKGLEIVGVSLDKDKASWLAASELVGCHRTDRSEMAADERPERLGLCGSPDLRHPVDPRQCAHRQPRQDCGPRLKGRRAAQRNRKPPGRWGRSRIGLRGCLSNSLPAWGTPRPQVRNVRHRCCNRTDGDFLYNRS